jgi:hypothetical protein
MTATIDERETAGALELDGFEITHAKFRVTGTIALDPRDPVHRQLLERLLLGSEVEAVCRGIIASKSTKRTVTSAGDEIIERTVIAQLDTVDVG